MEGTLWSVGQIVFGLLVLVVGGELLVRNASAFAAALRISPVVIGLTVVAFGTSSPELAVSLQSAISGNTDIAMGNVLGSNTFNILFVLGLSALLVPLSVSSQLIKFDVPIMVVSTVTFLGLSWDKKIDREDGAILFALLVIYLIWSVRQGRKENPNVQEEFQRRLQPFERSLSRKSFQLVFMSIGLLLLVFGARWFVKGAVDIAIQLGVSELIIGITIVAVGTSLPEVITSLVAAWRGERDIAVGNVVGSNIFNILGVIGLTAIAAPGGIPVAEDALKFDIPVMIAVAIACLPIFFTGQRIARWEGALFLFYYAAYLAFLVLEAIGTHHARTLIVVMWVFIIPLTLVTLAVTTFRAVMIPKKDRVDRAS